ncbi:MAG TPA: HPF/RaiA family ribosome-associated protein [Myxococcota bacterium]|jgi:ribosome-associated translation inhibitor RaiA|nr:HPF/RaiA family ribosome-associated protein [Myxococcota bacterium]
MSDSPTIVISFKDMPSLEPLRESLENGCRSLSDTFPETTRFEITIAPDGAGHTAHGRVTGRQTEIAAHAEAIEPAHAADKLLDTLQKQLRKIHDKHLFVQRRESQLDHQRKRG